MTLLPAPKELEAASFRDLRLVTKSFGGATALALLLVAAYAFRVVGWSLTLHMTWALGIWCAGGLLGFLFGIPKVLQVQNAPIAPAANPQASADASGAPSNLSPASVTAYRQRVNTNLEEISDWLTKIIVGVTLVQLKELPPQFSVLADQIVGNVTAPGNHRGFGLAIIVTFSTLGFLFGYLATRLYIQGALFRAERGLDGTEADEHEIQREIADTRSQITAAVGGPVQTATATVGPPPDNVLDDLQQLAIEYKDVDIADWQERTRVKNELAVKLAAHVIANGVSRDWLATHGDEAFVLALAGAVQAAPVAADVARLLRAGPRITRKHVQYWILLALNRLLEANLVTKTDRDGVRALLNRYSQAADESLKRLIASVEKRL